MNTSKIALYTNPDHPLNISASDAIINMFEHTDENGILYIPEWPYDNIDNDKERFYKCVMDWNFVDLDDALYYYESLYDNLKKIAENWDVICSSSAETVLSEDLLKVWNKYIRDFEIGDIDMEQISDISDKYETISIIASISNKRSLGEELSNDDQTFYSDYKDVSVTEEEAALYSAYKDAIYADSKRRVGDNLAAYDVVIRARRLCRLMSLEAPAIILENEARLLAQAMVIHIYCKNMETVEDVK